MLVDLDAERQANQRYIDFGKEKKESLAGLTDKEIEEKVTQLVKNEA